MFLTLIQVDASTSTNNINNDTTNIENKIQMVTLKLFLLKQLQIDYNIKYHT